MKKIRKDWWKIADDVPTPTKVGRLKTVGMVALLSLCLCYTPQVHIGYVKFYQYKFPAEYSFVLYMWGLLCSVVLFVYLLYWWSWNIRMLFIRGLTRTKVVNADTSYRNKR